MRNAEQEIARLKASVAIHRSRRERAEAMIDELASWVARLADVLRGEFCFYLLAPAGPPRALVLTVAVVSL